MGPRSRKYWSKKARSDGRRAWAEANMGSRLSHKQRSTSAGSVSSEPYSRLRVARPPVGRMTSQPTAVVVDVRRLTTEADGDAGSARGLIPGGPACRLERRRVPKLVEPARTPRGPHMLPESARMWAELAATARVCANVRALAPRSAKLGAAFARRSRPFSTAQPILCVVGVHSKGCRATLLGRSWANTATPKLITCRATHGPCAGKHHATS